MCSKYFFGEPLPLSDASSFHSILEETRTELGLGSVTVLDDQEGVAPNMHTKKDMAPPKLKPRKNKKSETKTPVRKKENRPKKPKVAVKRKDKTSFGQGLNAGDCHSPQVSRDKSQKDVNMKRSLNKDQEIQTSLVSPHESLQGLQGIPSWDTINGINDAYSQYYIVSQGEGREANPTDPMYVQTYSSSPLASTAKTSKRSKVIVADPYPIVNTYNTRIPLERSTIMTIRRNSGIRQSSIREILPPQLGFWPSSPAVSQRDIMSNFDPLVESPYGYGLSGSFGIERKVKLPRSKPVTCARDISMTTHVFLNEDCLNDDHFGMPPVAKRKSPKTKPKIAKIKMQPNLKSKIPRGRPKKKVPSLAIKKRPPIRKTTPLQTSTKQSGQVIKAQQERSWLYRWFWPSSSQKN